MAAVGTSSTGLALLSGSGDSQTMEARGSSLGAGGGTGAGGLRRAGISQTAMVITGYIAITQTGAYTFNLSSDDGSELFIGGQAVADNDDQHSLQTVTGTAAFTQVGLYAITLDYFEASGSAGLKLTASNPSGACAIAVAASCTGGTAQTTLFYSSLPAGAVPEPASLWVLAAGLTGMFAASRLASSSTAGGRCGSR